ncbi:MAG TPA: hypothetical protein VEQ65_04180 [Opitutus sp.]|nr:hypothetical protein [Opitutus sp.]
MLSLIPLLTLSLATAYVFAVLKMVSSALEAPVGFEDDEGFHYGVPVRVRVSR